MKVKTLLLGCGHSRVRKISTHGQPPHFLDEDLTTLDMGPNCGADIVMDFDGLGKRSWRHPFGKKLPFPDGTFDAIHAYDVLEHVGRQGDVKGYFLEFGEYHRILKVGGMMHLIVPLREDAIADPGHTRFFQVNYFGMLNQKFYQHNQERGTSCADYRWLWKKNFDIHFLDQSSGHHIAVVLKKT